MGGHGVGRNVLLAELSFRAAVGANGSAVWGVWQQHAWDDSDLKQRLAETGLRETVTVLRAGADAPDVERRSIAARAMDAASTGTAPSLLVLFAERGHQADIESVLGRVSPPLVCAVAPPWQTVDASNAPNPEEVRSPFRARIAFDPVLAAARLFPAIDPATSTAPGAWASEDHRHRAAEARSLLASARKLDPTWQGKPEGLRPAERNQAERARRLQGFLTQPFLTTESFVGDVGRTLSLESTLFGVSEILEGRCDDVGLLHFLYKGDLDDVRRSAAAS